MRVFYTLIGCPICNTAESCILEVNKHLPAGKQIEIVDIFSGDPRLSWLSEFFKSDSVYAWEVPFLVIDELNIQYKFGSLKPSPLENRVFVRSVWDMDHYIEFLETYLEIPKY